MSYELLKVISIFLFAGMMLAGTIHEVNEIAFSCLSYFELIIDSTLASTFGLLYVVTMMALYNGIKTP